MKVLILGSAGYLGPILSDYLKEQGHEVVGYDSLLYGGKADIVADIRDINRLIPAIDKADAVVNLAGMSMDLLEDMKPEITWNANYKANETITQLLKRTNKRVVYASSGSVYGVNEGVSEDSPLEPLTLYAKTKVWSEELYLHPHLNSVILRFATAYGIAPHPRFDTITNHMIADSYFKKKVTVQGSQRYRAIVHVKDISEGIYLALTKKNNFQIYNLGSDEQNYQILVLGEEICKKTGAELVIDDSSLDKRSYIIRYGRIKEDLGFEAKYTVQDAIEEFYAAFKSGAIPNMDSDEFYHIKYLKNHGSI